MNMCNYQEGFVWVVMWLRLWVGVKGIKVAKNSFQKSKSKSTKLLLFTVTNNSIFAENYNSMYDRLRIAKYKQLK